jgi:hypothetical protein
MLVTLDDAADDGERDERDDVRSNMENVIGDSAGDVFESLGAFSRLDGRGGDDSGGDNDIVDYRDGLLDTIDCRDAIDSDTLTKDGQERRVDGCESVQVGTLRLAPKRVQAEAGTTMRIRLSWRHPRAWRKLRRIELRLTQDRLPVGESTIRPRSERISDDGAIRLVRRATRLTRKGKAVTAHLAVRLDESLAGQTLEAEVEATERRGRRQLERDVGRIRVSG